MILFSNIIHLHVFYVNYITRKTENKLISYIKHCIKYCTYHYINSRYLIMTRYTNCKWVLRKWIIIYYHIFMVYIYLLFVLALVKFVIIYFCFNLYVYLKFIPKLHSPCSSYSIVDQ